MVDLKYFKPSEFRKASPSCYLDDMDVSFLQCLDLARDIAGIPFVINSAYRTKEYELSKGRSGTSSHCKGVAVDLRCSNAFDRYHIVRSLLCVGFRRIGISKYFIHVDADDSKKACIWLY